MVFRFASALYHHQVRFPPAAASSRSVFPDTSRPGVTFVTQESTRSCGVK